MTLTSVLAATLLLGILGIMLGAFGFSARREALGYERMRLNDMMFVRGARLPATLGGGAVREVALAVRRCASCRSKALCDEFLRRGAPSPESFCPNISYIERLRDR